ncbi:MULTISPECIES: hypothetical protein [Mycolicibacterium]|uniref:5,10-methylene-tetrahydrofolate dehydrogenase n=1 Tax=Mycolicibacterium senegalense TaxID=1796 RepID=A0A378W9B3_9MYCO|nr:MULTISPECIES: hypothetical protein [Mycolicibacterium]MCV7338213.1 hypothetical protein [Mycolicibacterium senegalense]MDR7287419.1 hypothetical protein [Mycolicibacterium senegalense]QZA24479.1 hypothetical protein K3U95_28495 [Mycolicibacterium senegalense]CDP87417.1 hypothetical protein BN975_03372 [Mycolicibacterium farcinogenes]SUA29002.1 Uncharacterised protein [Mycolicibacterium senegalense]
MQKVTVGLVADPGLSAKIVEALSPKLPAVLAKDVRSDVRWIVQSCSQALPLDEAEDVAVWKHGDQLKSQRRWDLLICVTEATRRRGETLVVSDTNLSHDAALISLPALGPTRLRHHVGRSVVRVLQVLCDGSSPARMADGHWHPTRAEVSDDADGRNAFVELSRIRGRLRLMLGMVRVNRPWRLLPSLSSAIAAAVAAAAFGVFYSSIWRMADAMSTVRLVSTSVVAILAMMLWLILYNGLWEMPRELHQRKNTTLYNGATLLTLGAGVGFMYVLLFLVVLLGALTIIPSGFLGSTLGHPVSWRDYAELAWLASSLGTFAGALGSSFESDYAVRSATYGKREQQRHARAVEP